ncbi:hypothetical protein C1Y63_05625 [Corynebacterium sp. 13CS0277]|uniref:hypothetical protein n=1 Tax=Corynebacterium sp. 13CS0277 TaxID=2071994 RepID=UPI000D04066F|nr:hypothetical protein [Corynebacterium sp. 13CS0277]PRQ11483.1 hypothetical protein C1Y63_05625 [Corynebacterium sp. 13CS0277]
MKRYAPVLLALSAAVSLATATDAHAASSGSSTTSSTQAGTDTTMSRARAVEILMHGPLDESQVIMCKEDPHWPPGMMITKEARWGADAVCPDEAISDDDIEAALARAASDITILFEAQQRTWQSKANGLFHHRQPRFFGYLPAVLGQGALSS